MQYAYGVWSNMEHIVAFLNEYDDDNLGTVFLKECENKIQSRKI